MIDLSTKNEWQHLCPETGLVMPWYTKPCLDEIATWDLENKTVLEIGGGASTLWWNAKAGWVLTMENNDEYFDTLQLLGHRVSKYDDKSLDGSIMAYDIIVIDGAFRDELIQPSLNCLKSGGALILDNWDQEEVWIPTEENQKKLTGMRHTIYKQEGHPHWKTMIVYK